MLVELEQTLLMISVVRLSAVVCLDVVSKPLAVLYALEPEKYLDIVVF